MIELLVGQKETLLVNASPVETDKLRKILSVRPKGYQFAPRYKNGLWDGYVLLIKRRRFPSGLLSYVIRKCIEQEIKMTYEYNYEIPEHAEIEVNFHDANKNGYLTLRNYQLDAVRTILKAKRGILHMATNAGKTLVAASIIKATGTKCVYIVPSKALLMQTSNELEKLLGIKVGRFGSGHAEFRDVTITTMHSAKHLSKYDLSNNVTVIVDECHRGRADILYTNILKIPGSYRIGMSGTPLTHDKLSDMKIMGATGEVVYEIKNIDLIRQGYSSNVNIFFHSFDDESSFAATGNYVDQYRSAIVLNDARNLLISRIVEKTPKPIMILTNWIEHADTIMEYLGEYSVVKVTGQDSGVSMKQKMDTFGKEYDILIATSVFSEGVNLPSIRSLVMAAGEMSHIRLLQRIGRGLRVDKDKDILTVHEFIDAGSKYALKHTRKRLALYKEEGFSVKLMNRNGS